MTGPGNMPIPPRLRALLPTPRRARQTAPLSAAERLLHALGADPSFAESVLGDLAEEYARRAAHDGVGAARRWYAREALRSAPHLVRSAARHASGRARLAAALAGVVLTATAVTVTLLVRVGPPARLVAGTRDTVVVNHVRPVRLPTRVFDAAGRALPDTGVRYAWAAGAPVAISPRGVVTCARPGDVTVRAALGALATTVVVRCRPVRVARATVWNDFVLGDPPRELPTEFVGVDGRPVTLLSARVSVRDSTVATLDGLRIRPLQVGRTQLWLQVGNRSTGGAVRVFAPVPTLAGLRPAVRPDQRLVAARVRLGPGELVRWPLPAGLFSLAFLPAPHGGPSSRVAAPVLRVEGPIMCLPSPGPRVYNTHCLARSRGASVTVAHPGRATPSIVGALAFAWDRVQ